MLLTEQCGYQGNRDLIPLIPYSGRDKCQAVIHADKSSLCVEDGKPDLDGLIEAAAVISEPDNFYITFQIRTRRNVPKTYPYDYYFKGVLTVYERSSKYYRNIKGGHALRL